MCTTAFFAFLRVGEITCCPRSTTVLQLNQIVQLVDSSGSITGLKITFLDFKHSYNRPNSLNVSITLKRRSDICPVQSLFDYFSRRGLSDGPPFRTYDGHAVSRKLFTDYLALIFRTCGLILLNTKDIVSALARQRLRRNVVFLMPKFGQWVSGNPTPFVSIFGVQACRDHLAVNKHFFWQTHLPYTLKLSS